MWLRSLPGLSMVRPGLRLSPASPLTLPYIVRPSHAGFKRGPVHTVALFIPRLYSGCALCLERPFLPLASPPPYSPQKVVFPVGCL